MNKVNLRKSIFLANLSAQLIESTNSLSFEVSEQEFEDFKKSVDFDLIIVEDANLQKFDQDLVKSIAHAFDKGVELSPDIEKAQRDRSKLVQVSITDKNGHKRKVWVKPGDAKAAMSGGKKSEEKSEPKVEGKKDGGSDKKATADKAVKSILKTDEDSALKTLSQIIEAHKDNPTIKAAAEKMKERIVERPTEGKYGTPEYSEWSKSTAAKSMAKKLELSLKAANPDSMTPKETMGLVSALRADYDVVGLLEKPAAISAGGDSAVALENAGVIKKTGKKNGLGNDIYEITPKGVEAVKSFAGNKKWVNEALAAYEGGSGDSGAPGSKDTQSAAFNYSGAHSSEDVAGGDDKYQALVEEHLGKDKIHDHNPMMHEMEGESEDYDSHHAIIDKVKKEGKKLSSHKTDYGTAEVHEHKGKKYLTYETDAGTQLHYS